MNESRGKPAWSIALLVLFAAVFAVALIRSVSSTCPPFDVNASEPDVSVTKTWSLLPPGRVCTYIVNDNQFRHVDGPSLNDSLLPLVIVSWGLGLAATGLSRRHRSDSPRRRKI